MSSQDFTPKKRPRWVKAFLASLALLGNVRLACETAEIDRRTAYYLREADPTFAAEWETALEDSADLLEQEARRRAEQGVQRLKFHNGSAIMVQALSPEGIPLANDKNEPIMVPYVEHEYSDTLAIFLLKGIRPEKYRERSDVKQRTLQTNVDLNWDDMPPDLRDAFVERRMSLDDVLRELHQRTTRA